MAADPILQNDYILAPEVTETYAKLADCQQVTKGLSFLLNDDEATLGDQKTLSEIPAPTFEEEVRATYYRKRLEALGLQEVTTDSAGNVFGVYKGTGGGPRLFVAAHLDTVFPQGTDLTVTTREGRLYGPGIADDARGLAAILSVVRALNAAGVKTVGDIVFGGTVGEEGLGDLRGVKAFFRDNKDIDGFITVDGTKVSLITYLATGSFRYEITYRGPGGHSFNAFGIPSPIHALGRAIAKIAEVRTPADPKTTFTVGVVSGGTSVNSIAAEATMLLDLRSNRQEELQKLENTVLPLLKEAAAEENARWQSEAITVEVKKVGDRPAGEQAPNSTIVQAAWASSLALGVKGEHSAASSTDANQPISLGIPSLRLGGGGNDGSNHSLGEWFDPAKAYLGPQKVFLTMLGLVGVSGVTRPLLAKK
jgi:tripeptide aminopeptidase